VPQTRRHSVRHAGQLLAYSVWLIAVALLAALAGVSLVDAIIHSSYDPHENRAPAGRIVIAALAFGTGLVACAFAVQRLRGKPRSSFVADAALTTTTALLIVVLAIVEIASGPL
jgi:hypothetical protein